MEALRLLERELPRQILPDGGHLERNPSSQLQALRHLIDHFALDPINTRTTAASGLADAIDEERLTAATPRDPVELPAVEVNESELDPACRNAAERRDLDLYAYADAHPELFARWDRRAKIRDDAYLIGDFLEQHNAGRIIRGR